MSRDQQRTHFYQAVLFSFECLNLSYVNGVSSTVDASASVMHAVFTQNCSCWMDCIHGVLEGGGYWDWESWTQWGQKVVNTVLNISASSCCCTLRRYTQSCGLFPLYVNIHICKDFGGYQKSVYNSDEPLSNLDREESHITQGSAMDIHIVLIFSFHGIQSCRLYNFHIIGKRIEAPMARSQISLVV